MRERPDPIRPDPGQESVWDYPRPPRVETTSKLVRVLFRGRVVAESRRALRLLETSLPPSFYLPPEDVERSLLQASGATSVCEWKGRARYFDVVVDGDRAANAAWCYPHPMPPFTEIAGFFAFYPERVDCCTVDGEVVQPQPGGFYGGWITADIVGPFKGAPGTEHW